MTNNNNTAWTNRNNDPNDECYTRMENVQKEVPNFETQFIGKTIYCNCDDPTLSVFTKYFTDKNRFKRLKLKQVITSCYAESDLFKNIKTRSKNSGYIRFDGRKLKHYPLEGNGSFSSPECVDLLRQSDIVVTNPPWSKIAPFLKLLVEYKKKFLIIAPDHAITQKDVWPLFQSNKFWFGVNKGSMIFDQPDGLERTIGNAVWFTNLHHSQHPPPPYG